MAKTSNKPVVELSIEFAVELLLFLYPYGADQMGLPHNFWLGLSCWIIGLIIAVRMFWIVPFWSARLTWLEKALIAFIVVAALVLFLNKPVAMAYRKRNLVLDEQPAPLKSDQYASVIVSEYNFDGYITIGRPIGVTIGIKNIGTVATEKSVVANLVLYDGKPGMDAESKIYQQFSTSLEELRKYNVSRPSSPSIPGQPATDITFWMDHPLTKEEAIRLRRADMTLYLIGLITYSDGRGPHSTEFCYYWFGEMVPNYNCFTHNALK